MSAQRQVTAVLGPTNTGKTHHAIERMLAHPSGMIGLPLRLLAREIYDRIYEKTGPLSVALVTGEEKIIPPSPRYWVCTVEAMPMDLPVSFLAVDEIQLAADAARGHVFTDRLLHARGLNETMLLGADTARDLVGQLVKGVNIVSRPRLSKLTFAGHKKITRLPKRTAIVAFSADMVYAVAELIRRQRGGAAVVMGALSPRTRNAQVELYQSGDVDHIVATDAIGMGLNMDIDHVAFAATRKFDGFHYRNLSPAEMGQIAGRAGRYMNDGTFGLTGEAGAIDAETVELLEDHRFQPLKVLQWRNRNLNFNTIDTLLGSLNALPNREGLTRTRAGADIEALTLLARDPEVSARATSASRVELLWETCQLPDYRNITGAEHAHLVASIFRFLVDQEKIDQDWYARQLSYCDNTNGDIDTLSNRIAHVRTWTFVANRAGWLEDAAHWQDRTRQLEDKLSDALHERLTQRFVDRRTSVLARRLREREELMSSVDQDGKVEVEGEEAGYVRGLRFEPVADKGEHSKVLLNAAQPVIASAITARAQALTAAPDTALSLNEAGQVIWMSQPVGQLHSSGTVLKPRVEVLADEQVSGAERDGVQLRLSKFVSRHVAAQLEQLVALADDEAITGLARGVAFQLIEALGVLPRDQVADQVKELGQDERAVLRKHGVRFGAFHIFMPSLLKPAPTSLRLLLWALHEAEKIGKPAAELPAFVPQQGLTSVPLDKEAPDGLYRVAGFRHCGDRVVRVDMLERLADMVRTRVFWRAQREGEERPEGSVEGGGFTVVPDMMSLVGCSGEEFSSILKSLGFSAQKRKAEDVVVGKPAEAAPKPEDASKAEAEKPATDHATDEPAAEATESEAGSSAAQAADTPAEQPVETSALDAAPEEPEMVEVWWPKDTGPFRQHKQARKPGGPARKGKGKGRGQPRHGADSGRKSGSSRPPRQRKEKQADPNSPFAVLGQLKQDLSQK